MHADASSPRRCRQCGARLCSEFIAALFAGVQPSDLYGKYTWTVGQFAEVSKRELRSGTFEAGGFKWYILVYPQGCDVANHLSLFLCVAEYDKLLPGWAHFAQFTVSVSHRDPHKSKYSDTLHRFCKKEHDWGWKKFMELGKVGEGFTAGDQLVVRAQVQVSGRPGGGAACGTGSGVCTATRREPGSQPGSVACHIQN